MSPDDSAKPSAPVPAPPEGWVYRALDAANPTIPDLVASVMQRFVAGNGDSASCDFEPVFVSCYLDGDVTASEKQAFEGHLYTCARCSHLLGGFYDVQMAYRQRLVAIEDQLVSWDCSDRVMERWITTLQTSRRRWTIMRTAVAAGVLGMIWVGTWWYSPQSPQSAMAPRMKSKTMASNPYDAEMFEVGVANTIPPAYASPEAYLFSESYWDEVTLGTTPEQASYGLMEAH